jgi:hypothetical protein
MSCNNDIDFESPENCCPSKFCDDRLNGLPTKKRFNLVGVEGRCLVRPHPNRMGIFLMDGAGGGYITQQPRLGMPILTSLLVDEFGKPIPLPGGGYAEDTPPPIDHLVGSACDGLQFRLKGKGGSRQNLVWDGCRYVHEDAPLDMALDEYQYIGPEYGYENVYEQVLIVQEDGTVVKGSRAKPSVPPGALMMWGGPILNMPSGWIACEGQELSKDEYPDLFEAWGYGWGGSGPVFRVPDGRGRFFRGVDHGSGIDPDAAGRTALHTGGNTGDAVGTYQGDSFSGTGLEFENDAANDTPIATEIRPKNIGIYMMAFAGRIISP